jgi:hypothetical protein
LQTPPEFVGRGEGFEVVVFAGKKVVLDDPVAVGGVSELESEDLGVFLGLLEAVAGLLIDRLCFHDRQGKVAAILQKVVGPFLRTACRFFSGDHDAAVGEAFLLADPLVGPAGSVELWQHVFTTCVGFGEHIHYELRSPAIRRWGKVLRAGVTGALY